MALVVVIGLQDSIYRAECIAMAFEESTAHIAGGDERGISTVVLIGLLNSLTDSTHDVRELSLRDRFVTVKVKGGKEFGDLRQIRFSDGQHAVTKVVLFGLIDISFLGECIEEFLNLFAGSDHLLIECLFGLPNHSSDAFLHLFLIDLVIFNSLFCHVRILLLVEVLSEFVESFNI